MDPDFSYKMFIYMSNYYKKKIYYIKTIKYFFEKIRNMKFKILMMIFS
jgi:hypothetical protein